MKRYKYKVLIGLLTLGFLSSCVDDYQDANPTPQLDGPAVYYSMVGDEVVATDTDSDTWTYVPNGGTARIEISIPDAPGQIDSVSFSLSNIQLPTDWGSVTIEGFEAIKGQTTGTFTVVYHAPNLDAESPFAVANENIVVNIYDGQDPRKVFQINTINPMRTSFSPGSSCFSENSLVGFYNAVSNGIDGETGNTYTDLTTVVEMYLLKSQINTPGYYRLSDGSFGLYGVQGFAGNFINFEVCGNQIVNANEEFTDNFSGTIAEDGVITINWSNSFGDSGTTVLTPQ